MATPLTFIYGLVDPETRLIHYVGKSTNPTKRLQFHQAQRHLRVDNLKNRWIRALKEKGAQPLLVVLQVITNGNWAEAERAWIVQGRMLGWPITNTSDGGEGVLPPTPETPRDARGRISGRVGLSGAPSKRPPSPRAQLAPKPIATPADPPKAPRGKRPSGPRRRKVDPANRKTDPAKKSWDA